MSSFGRTAVGPPQRGRRRVRRAATAVELLLALVGRQASSGLFGRPGSGTSAQSRAAAYVEAYERVISALPPPTAYDVGYRSRTVPLTSGVRPRDGVGSGRPGPRHGSACQCGQRTFHFPQAPPSDRLRRARGRGTVVEKCAHGIVRGPGAVDGAGPRRTRPRRSPRRRHSSSAIAATYALRFPDACLADASRTGLTFAYPPATSWDGQLSSLPCIPDGGACRWARWAESSTTRTTTWRK